MTLRGQPSAAELSKVLQAALGNLDTESDIQVVLNSLDATSTNSSAAHDAFYQIDIAPLHQEIMVRFQTKLMADERAIKAEAKVNLQE